MSSDLDKHPVELVDSSQVEAAKGGVTIDDLKRRIPPHCFESSFKRSFSYLGRDIVFITVMGWTANCSIPMIPYALARYAIWASYGYAQGLLFTGIWVHGHECGHGAFSPSSLINDMVGLVLHSALLTPYFSWRSTHRRHHIYANNLAKDHNYVPPQEHQYATYLGLDPAKLKELDELTEDAPITTCFRILLQQLIGWPSYITLNNTAARGSVYGAQSNFVFGNSHFLPNSSLFLPREVPYILLSDVGLIIMGFCLYLAGKVCGFGMIFLLYIQPYLWVNHWIVAITYLHHTDPSLPKYQPEAWSFMKGALATMDRDLGWVGKHLFHNIVDYHVIHHLFPHIPQYHAEEATKAIMPLLGDSYHASRKGYMTSLWESFTRCQYVKADDAAKETDRAYWYKTGPHPAPTSHMKYNGWL